MTKNQKRSEISKQIQVFRANGGKVKKIDLVINDKLPASQRLFPTFQPRVVR